MIKVFGSLIYSNEIPYIPKEDETCDQHCLDADYCIMTINDTSKCLEFSYLGEDNKLMIKRESSGSKVSFKVTLPDNNCPASFDNINLTLTLPTGEVKYWNQTETRWEWIECREEWKRFERSDGKTVCMQTFRVDEGINFRDSAQKCFDMGKYSLAGVATVEESKWIYGKMIETEGLYDMYSFWTSAKRECDSDGNCSVTWRDYYTTSLDALNTSTNYHESKGAEDCLAVAYMEEAPTKTITDVFCDSETMLQGYVCGYVLKI
ncbi:hypothetical protein B9Z55_015651 [Caenorhabditis nigoni]|uniref:PAN-3 domain-containing protein n=1 Tax=Caenorhabditis nigoni TaxID=1611254 RepID=A0A2G5UBH8_9PELO|nr:hypothetical protein B9Z55_015651 [Caenorhabditis nigoni]